MSSFDLTRRELSLGSRDAVTHWCRKTFTESTIIYIPPNFIHSPWRPLRVDKPFLFIEVNQGPEHTEKFYPQLLPKEAREKIDWSRWPDKGF